ncbi:MAG: crotonase/enoyl-CoA hydratase family protein [Acidimicrobiia bacterium]|nr:crotonase/enoyl-CoA hydratase family protein [Acidimicrobiia bacterium]
MHDTVRTERHDKILVVTIDRPEARNAVDRPTAAALEAAFAEFDRDSALSVAVLTGADGTFCAGADLKAIASDHARANRVTPDGPGPMGPTRLALSKPVIAAVEGYAVAGGLELAVWCDLRVSTPSAVFGVYCRRWGVPLLDGGTIRLPRLIGASRAADLILTGRGVSGHEAFDMGLVNRLVPDGRALAAALDLARSIATFPQACVRHDRLSSLEQWSLSLEDALANEYTHGWSVIESGETFSGASRFTAGKGRGGSFDDIQ